MPTSSFKQGCEELAGMARSYMKNPAFAGFFGHAETVSAMSL